MLSRVVISRAIRSDLKLILRSAWTITFLLESQWSWYDSIDTNRSPLFNGCIRSGSLKIDCANISLHRNQDSTALSSMWNGHTNQNEVGSMTANDVSKDRLGHGIFMQSWTISYYCILNQSAIDSEIVVICSHPLTCLSGSQGFVKNRPTIYIEVDRIIW